MCHGCTLEMQRYIAYRIILRQYRCIDTKSNHINISRIVIYRHIVAVNMADHQIIVHFG